MRRRVVIVLLVAAAAGAWWVFLTPHDAAGRVERWMKDTTCTSVDRVRELDGTERIDCNMAGGSVHVLPADAPASDSDVRCVVDDAVLVDGLIFDGFADLCEDLDGRLER